MDQKLRKEWMRSIKREVNQSRSGGTELSSKLRKPCKLGN